MIYDVTKKSSFENIQRWIQELHDHANPDTILVLVGNKTDLSSARQVSTEEARLFADRNKLPFIETSALDSTNVDIAFFKLLEDIYDKKLIGGVISIPPQYKGVVPDEKSEDVVKNDSCCGL